MTPKRPRGRPQREKRVRLTTTITPEAARLIEHMGRNRGEFISGLITIALNGANRRVNNMPPVSNDEYRRALSALVMAWTTPLPELNLRRDAQQENNHENI